ncbi:non-ribosomal peptide synthetase, partial [Actinomadura harenae]
MSSLAELFARQAAWTPRAPALLTDRGPVDYAELDRRSAALAAELAARGVGPESRVGVLLPRGPDLVTALLAVWRVGGAYVPLDPEHPARRSAQVLQDTAPAVLVTGSDVRVRPSDLGADAPVVHVEDAYAGHRDAPRTIVPADPDTAAYVLHTSGSTGRPKGVVVTHGGIANRVLWTVRRHRLGPADRILHKTAVTFDAAGWEIFAPLVSGGAVAIAPPGADRDPALLLRSVAAHRATVLQVVPSLLRVLVGEPDWSGCETLRLLFSAGEPLDAELCRQLLERHGCEIWNTYGPTECAIDVAAHRVDPAVPSGPVPLGRAIDRTRLRVLDEMGEPVPVGVPGELYVGGAGVARGYAGRPDLTAERFVPDPYGLPGARLYRTGDLVAWRADGRLRFLGRIDRQVKVNGVRIEPAEVEGALTAHPGVGAAAVTARDGRLVAYVTPARGLAVAPAGVELRAHLRDRLPAPMVPAVFVPLAELPLTASGKIDRGALPAGDGPGPSADRRPLSAAEWTVAECWMELLDGARPGPSDDFFKLGGHSLLLAGLAARLRERTGAPVDVADLYSAATVERQAALLTAARPAAGDEGDGAVPRARRDGPQPASHGQRRMWLLDRMNPGAAEYTVPLMLRLDVTPDVLERALTRLAARHEALRTRFRMDDADLVQVVDPPRPVPVRVVDAEPGALPGLVAAEVAEGFDLRDGPVWRGTLLREPGAVPLVLLTFHHIACDGTSLLVVERELRELCATGAAEDDVPDPDRIDHVDYTTWQRRRVETRAAADLDHWRRTLAGAEPLDLPADRPRPAVRDAAGAVVRWTLPADRARQLVRVGHAHGATPYTTLLTAFACLLGGYAGTRDLLVGSPVSDRVRPELEPVVGFLSETLVHRLDLSGDPDFGTALTRAAAVVRASLAHRHVPFDRLVAELAPGADRSRTPLFQVMFDLQDDGVSGPAEDPADAGLLDHAWRVARTDLGLTVRRSADGALAGRFEYATALFGETTVRRLADRFVRLLGALADRPRVPVGDLATATGAERC